MPLEHLTRHPEKALESRFSATLDLRSLETSNMTRMSNPMFTGRPKYV